MKLSLKSKGLKILFLGCEAAPFIKIGGLGEVMYSLPKALRELGHDARIMIPYFSSIPKEKFPMEMIMEGISIPSGREEHPISCNVKVSTAEGSTVPSYFLENMEYFEQRGNVYGYDDDGARFAVFSRAALEFVKRNEDWRPDIIVSADWQGGLTPNLMKTEYANDPIISKIASVFCIHNLHFQGMFDHRFTNEMDYDDGRSVIPPIDDPRMLKINFMRRGILFADIVNTVSPNYAQEITTPDYGELLDGLLSERRSRLFGILNGIDYTSNDPTANPYVEYKYSVRNLNDRQKNKAVLQRKFNLEEEPNTPLVAIVSRLAEQKGMDLVIETIEPLLENFKFQLVVLGNGDSKYLSFFADLEKKYSQVATHLSFDTTLPHVVHSGADLILVPSKFEPSGLTQMEAMHYGALPLVRKTGGLADSVVDYNENAKDGAGFVFEKYDKYAFFGAFVRALETYKHPKEWVTLQKHAMTTDFSWKKSAKEYVELFKKAMAFNSEEKNQ